MDIRAGAGRPLDLSGVDFPCARGISVLNTLDKERRTAGTYWVIVGSPFVERLLHVGDTATRYPWQDRSAKASMPLPHNVRRVVAGAR